MPKRKEEVKTFAHQILQAYLIEFNMNDIW